MVQFTQVLRLPPFLQRLQHQRRILSSESDTDHTISERPTFGLVLRSRRVRVVSVASLIIVIGLILFGLPNKRPRLRYPSSTDWSRFAYTQYATNTAYLCNSLMLFETLHRLRSSADRLLMFPASFENAASPDSVERKLLRKARDEFNVKLQPIEVQRKGDDGTWAESFTKLLAFNQTQYDRVLSLDSDSTILQTIDELFLIPPSPVAMPRAYWLENRELSSQLILIQPSNQEFERIQSAIVDAGSRDFDMEIVNTLYGKSATVLPHRPYNMVTGEFRAKDHTNFMGNDFQIWDPVKILDEVKYVHFSDWPRPKPWILPSENIVEGVQPECLVDNPTGEQTDCRARDVWLGLYRDFAQKRKDICGLDLDVP